MSFQAMTWAIKQKVGDAKGKAVLLILANFSDHKGYVHENFAYLEQVCELHADDLDGWVSEFEEQGLLSFVGNAAIQLKIAEEPL